MNDNLQLLSEMSSREMIFRNDIIPELEHGTGKTVEIEKRDCEAYNTPILMAMSAPIFSFLLIATFQTIFHGRRESRMSSAPE